MGDSGAIRRVWRRHPVGTGYVVAVGALAVAALVVGLAARGTAAAAIFLALTCLAALPLVLSSVRWTWRKLTYRVGVRLFISYLLIGLTPFALFACAALIAGYVLTGQYAAIRVRSVMDRVGNAMAGRAAAAVREMTLGRVEHARELLGSGGGGTEDGLCEEWILADGSREWCSPGAGALPVPSWVEEGTWHGDVLAGSSAFLAVVERRGARIAALLLPLDLANARAFPGESWFEVRFIADAGSARGAGATQRTVTIGPPATGEATPGVRVDGRPVPATEVESGWLAARPRTGSLWQRARVVWIWLAGTPLELATGKPAEHALALTLIKLSPRGAIEDLLGTSEKVWGEVRTVAITMAGVFGGLYLIAAGFAFVMILRVTRATARLSRGARAVARGELDHRIPVRLHDQLGDLAVSFNAMAGSVRGMLAQVAEKERMAKEVELAREIQSSLLPPAQLSSGPLSVWAHFRPAAEVGGDYFDVFPIPPGNLLVAIGDVAGHGLPTGLLMAMVKSAVATLVEEGYRGVELLSRLNHLLLAQSLRQRMVSFALAEVDAPRREVKITSAGHQPGVLLAAAGPAQEVLLSSLPLGHRWPDAPPSRTLSFGPGGRLLLYSDGLVEARDADETPFGHERLREALEEHRADDGPELVRALLAELDRHLAGQPLADDLTIVLVEHRAPPRQGPPDPRSQ
jgi:serine phosphatase RsbU (regulator of sigma subunit)